MANESLIKLLKVFGLYSVVTKSEEACTPGALAVLFFVEIDLCVDSSCLFVRAGALLSILSLSVFLLVLKAFLIVF